MSIAPATLAAILRRYDPALRLLAARPLEGGVSATVLRLDVDGPAGRRALVLRRHGAADLAANPQVAAQEFALLRWLRAAGQPVPAPLLLDEAGDLLPTPYLLQSFVPGDGQEPADLGPATAAALAALHALPAAGLEFLPRRADQVAALLDQPAGDPEAERIRALLRARWPFGEDRRLLHGDLWPGNLVWHEGRIVAVVDWEDAALGDPLADLGHARIELLWGWGWDTLQSFTRHYMAASRLDARALPLWDLVALLDKLPRLGTWRLGAEAEASMRSLARDFAEAAMALLPSS